jgi:glycine/D-amino acid oxidase-like deaminating enzyme
MSPLKRIYHADAYDTDTPVGSYWEAVTPSPLVDPVLEGDFQTDVVVIGAGFTGLSSALHLAKDHSFAPIVLDAGHVGWGASGRNAGFNCMGGGKLSNAAYLKRWGEVDLSTYYAAQVRATEVVDELLQDNEIDVDRQPKGEWLLAHRRKDFDGFAEDAAFLNRVAGVKSEVIGSEALRESDVNGAGAHGAMFSDVGFCLNPRKYVFGLADAVRKAGGRIFGNSLVEHIERLPDGRFGVRTGKGRVVADRLILAGNGYNSENLPDWMGGRYTPVVSHIMVTERMGDNVLADQGWRVNQMSCDTRKMLHYFRLLPDGRMLFGMRGTPNLGPQDKARMPNAVRGDFDAMFPAWAGVRTAYHWSGLICVARNLVPYVGPIGEWNGAFTALAFHGNGVSMGSYSGKILAGMVADKKYDEPLSDGMKATPERYPIAQARRWALPLAFKWYGWQDR